MNSTLLFRALKHRNYKLFFSGQIISLTGTWMQQVALSWLVYKLTNSAFMLGLVGFSSQIPTFILSPFAGVLIDRWNKHRLIVTTQVLLMLQAAILTILVFSGTIDVWHIILLNVFSGLINGFDMPARQAFLVDMVEKREDLSNAIALNSSMFNAARFIGPSAAGFLIAAAGEGTCFLINTVSYIAVIIALMSMKIKTLKHSTGITHILKDFKEGFKYTFGFKPISTILFLIAVMSLVGMPYTVLMPVFAGNVLQGNALTLGMLMGSIGVGALLGAVYMASRKTVFGLGKVIVFAGVSFGTGLIFFSNSSNLILSMILLLITGASMMIQMASANTILQTIVEDNMRGRVMSFYTMSFIGMTPFGSLIAGSLAGELGASLTLTLGGILCITGAMVFASQLKTLRKLVIPIYERKGIIPEIATGIQAVSNLRVPPEN